MYLSRGAAVEISGFGGSKSRAGSFAGASARFRLNRLAIASRILVRALGAMQSSFVSRLASRPNMPQPSESLLHAGARHHPEKCICAADVSSGALGGLRTR